MSLGHHADSALLDLSRVVARLSSCGGDTSPAVLSRPEVISFWVQGPREEKPSDIEGSRAKLKRQSIGLGTKHPETTTGARGTRRAHDERSTKSTGSMRRRLAKAAASQRKRVRADFRDLEGAVNSRATGREEAAKRTSKKARRPLPRKRQPTKRRKETIVFEVDCHVWTRPKSAFRRSHVEETDRHTMTEVVQSLIRRTMMHGEGFVGWLSGTVYAFRAVHRVRGRAPSIECRLAAGSSRHLPSRRRNETFSANTASREKRRRVAVPNARPEGTS